MGCVCTKEKRSSQRGDFSFSKERLQSCKKRSSDPARFDGGKKGNADEEKPVKANGVLTTTMTTSMKTLTTVDEKREKQVMPMGLNPRPRNPPRHIEGEQIAAGWPAWLSAVAREAIQGWIPRRADSFEKLDKIGQGTYSNVYKARDLETGKIVALKKVRFDNLEQESVRFMAREIQVLRRLEHPNVVKLEGLVTSRMSCSLYLVFEYMEHDLAGLSASLGKTFTEPQVKCYLQQLLRGLDYCHNRGVLHRDIKGSNLLLDNSGILKIADFGLATFFHPDQKQPLTSRVVTLWYRPPELLLGATEYGVAVDLWSTGCILAELLAGKPIMPGRTEVEQLHKIFKLCGSPSEEYWKKSKLPHATIFKPKQPYKRCIRETFKDFPLSALALIETLLAIEPVDRSTAAAALDSEFFKTKPFACDPSSLPKYPPSKELDAKLRDEESRRHRAAGGRAHGLDAAKKMGYTSKAVPAPEANAELATSILNRRLASYSSVKSQSEKFNPRQEEAVGFPIEPPKLAEGTAVYRHHNDSYVRKQEGDSRMVTSQSLRSQPFYSSQIASQPARDRRNAEPKQASVATWQRDGPGIPEPVKQQVQDFNAGQAGRMHFSGPLLYPSANVDEILGQHERQIQQAVRRSRQGKIYYEGNMPSQTAWHGVSNGNVRAGESGELQEVSQMSNGQRSKTLKRCDTQVLPSVMENCEREHEV